MAKPNNATQAAQKKQTEPYCFQRALRILLRLLRQFRIEGLVHRPHSLLKHARDFFGAGVFTQHGYRGHRTQH